MGVIARRLQDQGEDWRHVYKSLLLLEYMSKHGPQKARLISSAKHDKHIPVDSVLTLNLLRTGVSVSFLGCSRPLSL